MEELPGRVLPSGAPVGESWDVVDRPEAQSVVRTGPWKGSRLGDLMRERRESIMGPGFPLGKPFPILVKWLDCAERLSLQVHPPASLAKELGGEPKTENWYIARASPGAGLFVGLKRGVTTGEFRRKLAENRLEECLHRFPAKTGQSILVRSGQIHAIDAGNLILEIQQNSDTTYRVYDWGRMGLDGHPRQLHPRESLASIDFLDFEPEPVDPAGDHVRLAECPEFAIDRKILPAGATFSIPEGEQPRLIHVVRGWLCPTRRADFPVREGETVLLPFDTACLWEAAEKTVVLQTENFFRPMATR